MEIDQILIAYLHNIQILLERFNVLDLVNLRQVHLILYQSVLRLKHVFLAHVVIDSFFKGRPILVSLLFDQNLMCLELFEDLFTSNDLVNLLVYFRFLVSIEYVVYSLVLVINDEDLSFIFARVSSLVNDGYVAFDQIEFLQA